MRTLATRAPTSLIERAERADGVAPITAAHEAALRLAFESAGVEFTNGDAPGVKLKGANSERAK